MHPLISNDWALAVHAENYFAELLAMLQALLRYASVFERINSVQHRFGARHFEKFQHLMKFVP
jgi:hypothetical protein